MSRSATAARLAVVLAALLAAPLGAGERALELSPCADDVNLAGAECGRLEVFEDREAGRGRRIELKVVVLPALGQGRAPDPLFLLAGGPGMPASAMAGLAKSALRRVRDRREIVLVDQRGTGDLSPLRCDDIDADSTYFSFDQDLPVELLRGCLERFEADPRQYTTPAAMDDLDDVRQALGYERINLWGGSYGTRAALVYLRRHPERVRAVVLDGVAPTGMRMPVHIGEDALRSVELMLSDCEADPDCGAAFPEVRSRYQQLLHRLEEAPETVEVPHPRTGEVLELELRRRHVLFLLRSALYDAETSRLLPLVIERAHGGDYGPLLALSDPFVEGVSEMNVPLLFSVLCAEDLAWVTEEDRSRVASEPFLGSAVLDLWAPVCDFWPKGSLPAGYHDPVVSDKPVLVLSGELDPVTPPRWGESVARHLSNSLHVVVPGAAHGASIYGCVPRLIARFLEDAGFEGLDAACVEDLRRPMYFRSFTGPRVGAAAAEGGAQ